MIKHSITAFAVAALTSALAVDASAQVVPNTSEVFIEDLFYNGSGCPEGSTVAVLAEDRKSFELIFSEYFASAGPDIAIGESRRNCQIRLPMHVPQGLSFAVAAIDYRGYVQLDPRVVATQKSTYWFANELTQGTLKSTFVGPLDQDYLFRDTVKLPSLVWSSCTETKDLEINTQVKVTNFQNRAGSGLITNDSIAGEVTQKFALAWRTCP